MWYATKVNNSQHTLGKHIFLTRDLCQQKNINRKGVQ